MIAVRLGLPGSPRGLKISCELLGNSFLYARSKLMQTSASSLLMRL
jgi:hypothetical protein